MGLRISRTRRRTISTELPVVDVSGVRAAVRIEEADARVHLGLFAPLDGTIHGSNVSALRAHCIRLAGRGSGNYAGAVRGVRGISDVHEISVAVSALADDVSEQHHVR